MSGYFFISSACLRLSFSFASMNSCASSAAIGEDELDLLAALDLERCGPNSPSSPLPSFMVTWTVRTGFFGLPGSPAEKCSPS